MSLIIIGLWFLTNHLWKLLSPELLNNINVNLKIDNIIGVILLRKNNDVIPNLIMILRNQLSPS